MRTVAILPGWRGVFVRGPSAVRLDSDLVGIPDLAENLLDVLVNCKGFVGYRLVAYGTRPCRCLLLKLQKRLSVKALIVCAHC